MKIFILAIILICVSSSIILNAEPSSREVKGDCSSSNKKLHFKKKVYTDKDGDGTEDAVTTVWCNDKITTKSVLIRNNGANYDVLDQNKWIFNPEDFYHSVLVFDTINYSTYVSFLTHKQFDIVTLIEYTIDTINTTVTEISPIYPIVVVSPYINTTIVSNNYFNVNELDSNTIEVKFYANQTGFIQFNFIGTMNQGNFSQVENVLLQINSTGLKKTKIKLRENITNYQTKTYNIPSLNYEQ